MVNELTEEVGPSDEIGLLNELASRRLGVEAARRLYDHWDPDAVFDGEFTQGFAEAFIDEYSTIQAARAGSVDRVSSKRAGEAAVQLTAEAFRGILEVLQNAEDEAANYLTVALRRNGGRKELLFVHDGERVRARTVVAMTSAYLSLKEKSARKIGKFGIGLKTLQRLGPELEVHCGPYHWAVSNGDARRIDPAPQIADLYDPARNQTMMVLRLHPGEALEGLWEWFEQTDARTLLFLQHVRTFEYRELGRRSRALSHRLKEGEHRVFPIQVGRREVMCDERVLESSNGKGWRRYSVELPVGEHARRGKVVDDDVPLAVAVPSEPQEGLLFSGLPTGESIGLPFDVGGPFESDVSRERLDTGSTWNTWLLDETRKLVQAIAAHELKDNPGRAWTLVGLRSEARGVAAKSPWLSERLEEFVEREQRALVAAQVVLNDRAEVRLRELVYESPALTSVLNEAEVEAVRPGFRCLPRAARDEHRWRLVLQEILDGAEVGVSEAVKLFDHELADKKKPTWFVALAACAVHAGLGDELFNAKSVMLSDGERIAPSRNGQGCLLVSRTLAGTNLVARLALALQIHPAYATRSSQAIAVRGFLTEHGAFSDEHSADAVLKALSGRTEDPVALTDDDLGELAGFIAEASNEFVETISADLGRAVTVRGFEWVDGERSYCAVMPSLAYLPAAMDEKDGWAKAAGTTPGITWIHPRYAKLKRLLDAEIGPRKLFRRLGAETAPRLQRPSTRRPDYREAAYGLGWVDLPELWERNRQVLGERLGHRPEALLDDWTSPELLAAAADIAASKVDRERRERAASLIRTLERAWSRLYEDTSDSVAVYGYRGWRPVGSMPTTWVARLADVEWLSDCSKRPRPAAPVNTRIRSDANATVYGNDSTAYAYELGPADADSPVVRALGIGGLPRASEHLDALRALREAGTRVGWGDVAHHYLALSQMCPARPVGRSEVDDITVTRLASEFRTRKLLWCGKWLSPADVFRGEELFPGDAAFVPEEEAFLRLWEALGIKYPAAPDCVRYLKKWAAAGKSPDEMGETLRRTYRALGSLAEETSSRVRKDLGKLPVWVGAQWSSSRPVYYSDSEVLAGTLADSSIPVWRIPCALHALGNLPEYLGLDRVSPADFMVAGRGGANSVFDSSAHVRFENALELMREFVSQSMPELYAEIPDEAWAALDSAKLELVPALTLEGKVGAGTLRIDAHVHLDRDEMRFYFESPTQIGRRDVGGALVADAFDLGSAEKLNLSLAWVDSWQRASEGEEQLHFPALSRTPGYISGSVVPEAPSAPAAVPRTKKGRSKAQPTTPAKRQLVDVDALVANKTRDAAAVPPVGRIISHPIEVRLDKPHSGGVGDRSSGGSHKSAPGYVPWDRETAGLQVLRKVLAPIEVQDTRTQRTGADGVGTDGRYYELKVHGAAAGGPLEMRGSEVLQARDLGDRYVLAVVENVEAAGVSPKITLIPNPMSVLRVHPLGKIEVTGYDDEAFEQWELPEHGSL